MEIYEQIYIILSKDNKEEHRIIKSCLREHLTFPYQTFIIDPKFTNINNITRNINKPKIRWFTTKFIALYSVDDFLKSVYKCPICKHENLVCEHTYSQKNPDFEIQIKCSACNTVLISAEAVRPRILDAWFVYNYKIHKLMDQYILHYPDDKEKISENIYKELKKTETYGYLGCQ